ncbi:MAG: T9SS type A sorting domain-containing protein [Bacteroidetes bacterium]|nr:T9SS type A sorting domain-containing protein [Bacteroidota bacterium]
MKKALYSLFLMLFVISFSQTSFAQIKLQEGFETTDTIPGALPSGWSLWNHANFPIDPTGNWTVRDSGHSMPGLSNALSKSHSGKRSMGATWYAAIDTNAGTYEVSDAWLVTKRVDVTAGDSLRFFVSGGSASYLDSMQVWVCIIDSMPENFLFFPSYKLASISFPAGSTYGQFVRKAYSLNFIAGQTAWVGFRYYTDAAVDGFAVYLDDVMIGSPNVGVTPTNSNVPDKFALEQNYPNPFNPTTNIKFSLPKASNVQLIIYNSMGQEVKSLMNEYKSAGSYSVDFNASNLASGTYFYKIITSDFTETKKMTLVK